MIDFNDTALFVQVARSGSFAAASRRLGIPSNTVSRRIQDLERQLGTRLLQRSTRKLTLTSAGQGFHERCAGAVDGLFDAAQELIRGTDEPSGLVRIAAPADFFDFFLMEWVGAFMNEHPRVRLDFILSDAKTDLIGEQIDVAFRGGALQDLGYVGRQVVAIGNDGLVASPAYLAVRGTPKTLEQLAGHDCVGMSHGSGQSSWQLTGPDGMRTDFAFINRFSANTAQALKKAVVAGLGIGLLPRAVASRGLNSGELVAVLPEYHAKGYGLNVVYSSRHHLPLAVSAFINTVVEKMATLDA